MQYRLDDRGAAENALMEALAGLADARAPLRRLVLAQDPAAFVALSLSRAAEQLAYRANQMLSDTKKAA